MATLDWRAKQPVKYAVPLWQRDENIRKNTAAVPDRIAAVDDPRPEPCAVVGYGPSLRETWEEIRRFEYIVACSGATRFLVDRGIVPQWHVAVDPLPGNTVRLIGAPHPDVEYLIASTCDPDVIEHLTRAGAKVRLWHIFDSAAESLRVLPPGEWALTGGCDVGLRALVIAGFFGFREIHAFGLDGSAPASDAARHAGDHPSRGKQYSTVEYEGRTYWTTPAMLEAARSIVHELEQMPKVRVTFYGDGLTQAMARAYQPKPGALTNLVGFQKPRLISPEYIALNRQLHDANSAYGVGGEKHVATVLKLCAAIGSRNVLDYGCGKGRLGAALPFGICEYDPAIPGKDAPPRPADLVVCTDVLEHVEPEHLSAVLADLKRCVRQVGFFTIHTGPAQKTLADGRNTHLIQHGIDWWRKVLGKFFTVGKIVPQGPELVVVVGPKRTKPRAEAVSAQKEMVPA